MKERVFKGIALMLVIILLLPMISFSNENTASAKARKRHRPSVSFDSKTLVEAGETFQLSLDNIGDNIKNITWYSQNEKVATVQASGDAKTAIVSSARKGTTFIKCKITYKDGTVVRPYCKVTVKLSEKYDDYDDNDDHDHALETVNVKDIVLLEATKLAITFDKEINSYTVIGINKNLLSSVTITPQLDMNGVVANTLGNLTASLSEDGKTLTIQAANNFRGLYGIHLLSTIKTTDGIAIKEYNTNITLKDTKAPSFVDYTLDKTGLIVNLNFNEAMDFSDMYIIDAKVLTLGQTAESTTLSILNTELFYETTADKKSLVIDLTNMPVADRNKMFSVRLHDVKDLEGNNLSEDSLTINFGTNTKTMPQAKLISLERTAYNTLTARFDRAIKTPGWIIINTEWIEGKVDSKDYTKVNYTLPTALTLLNDWGKVLIGYWDGYYVIKEADAVEVFTEVDVNFTMNNLMQLPAPTSTYVSLSDNNSFFVQFSNIIDEETAENKANYYIEGVAIKSAELIDAFTVKINLEPNTITNTKAHNIMISGIKGYSNSYTTMNPYQTTLILKDNSAPALQNLVYSYPTTITLTFNEALTGTPAFAVIQNNVDIASYSMIIGNTIVIILKNTPSMTEYLQIQPKGNNIITDIFGNKTTSILNQTIYPTTK